MTSVGPPTPVSPPLAGRRVAQQFGPPPRLLPDDARAAADGRAQPLFTSQTELGQEDLPLTDLEPLDGLPAGAPLALNAQLAGLRRLAPGAERPLVGALGDERESEGGQRSRLGAPVEAVQPRLVPAADVRKERRVHNPEVD